MAMYDNKYWLLSRIENAFITGDDTGISEIVMSGQKLNEKVPEEVRYLFNDEKDTDDEDRINSYNECFDTELGFRRQRSNTAARLEKMEKDKKENASITRIKWREPKPFSSISEEEKDIMFPTHSITNESFNNTSLLSEQIKNHKCQPKNPFKRYVRFDGSVQIGVPVRKFDIFVKMLPSIDSDYPLAVSVISTAKVSDLIGFVLWKCSLQYPNYKPKDSVKYYELYIVEDDGEIDGVFPCLDPRESVSKFIFRKLALIEKSAADSGSDNQNSQNKIESDIHVPPPLTMPSNKIESVYSEIDSSPEETPTAMDALLYKSYKIVQLCYGIANIKMEVDFGVSSEKIDIDPVVKHNNSFFSKRKPVSYSMESIIACDLTKTKNNGKATFRLVYDDRSLSISESNQSKPSTMDDFKSHDFETKQNVADEIVRKVNHIIGLHHCSRRTEYLQLRERKSHRRRSFHFGPR